MNINFHYYTVRALAQLAGFPPEEAQLIAEYSQFIDDYATRSTIRVTQKPPQEAIESGLAKPDGRNWKIELVTTGFMSTWDTAQLQWESVRRSMLIPFHFPPAAPLQPATEDIPISPAIMGDGSEVSNCLATLQLSLAQGYGVRVNNLIYLGMLLHVFADTYAHQNFSGSHSKSANNYEITNVKRYYNPSDQTLYHDQTTRYQNLNAAVAYKRLPAIGHGTVGHAPDDTYVSFNLVHQNTPGKIYARDNRDCFIQAAEQIYTLLRLCLPSALRGPAWGAALADSIRKGFYADNDLEESMVAMWSLIFPQIAFDYNPMEIMNRLFTSPVNAELSENDSELQRQTIEAIFNETGASAVSGETENSSQAGLTVIDTEVRREFYAFTLFADEWRHTIAGTLFPS